MDDYPWPTMVCCADFNDDVVCWTEPSFWWGPEFGPSMAWCAKEPSYYGEVIYHPVKFCPWCGTCLPVPVSG